jgi:hypothetical protein
MLEDMSRRDLKKYFLECITKEFGDRKTVSRPEILEVSKKYNFPKPPWWLLNDTKFRSEQRGEYKVPSLAEANSEFEVPLVDLPVSLNSTLIPAKIKGYVKFGHYEDINRIIKSGKFYPVYITGLSGNGKTMMVDQICANLDREMIRVNITTETDEDDLIGGFRLIGGETQWQDGPVIQAMTRGCILLLDEVDLGSYKLMCLQPILEGKGIYLKKCNKWVRPTSGFNVLATANTKGKGSDDGRFVGTNVMNEAFLERFSITMEQEYPPEDVEKKILSTTLKFNNIEDNIFVTMLAKWAYNVRKSYASGACSEIISTRRLVHICEAYAIFDKDRMKSIKLCINRFDDDTKESLLEFYKKIDEEVNAPPIKYKKPETVPPTDINMTNVSSKKTPF